MSLFFRLAGARLGPQILRHDCTRMLNAVRPVTIKCTPAVAEKNESHDERNMRLGRPQSPHLTIYKPQLTAMLSITHRATGMALSAYTIALGLSAVYLQLPLDHYIEQLKLMQIGAGSVFALKFLVAFPLSYHFFNGIRHLLWDTAKFLSIKEVYATGYAMLAVATAGAIVLSGMRIVLAGQVICFSAVAVYLEWPMEYYIDYLRRREIGALPMFTLKFMISFPLTYHFCNGIRHLFWDFGQFLSIREVYATGWLMLTLAIASAVIVSGMTFNDGFQVFRMFGNQREEPANEN